MKHRFENHDRITERASQLIDVTGGVQAAVDRAGQRVFRELDRSCRRKVLIQVSGG
jgi:hypothetical protein